MVTAEMFQMWKENPVTQKFLEGLNDNREEMKEVLARGGYENDDVTGAIARMETIRLMQYSIADFDTFAEHYMVKGI